MATKKVVGNAGVAAAVTPVIVWGWNISFPEIAMPAEVAASLGALVGIILAYAISFMPVPE